MVLPAPDGPTSATRSPGATLKLNRSSALRLGPQRIGEGHVAEGDLAARRLGQRLRLARRFDLRLDLQQLAQPLGGAHALRDLAPGLAQAADGGRREHGVEHELREPAAGHRSRQHVLRAVPQHADDAGKHQEDGDGRQSGARLGPRIGRLEGTLDRLAEALRRRVLMREGLHHPDLRQGSRWHRRKLAPACPAPRATALGPSGHKPPAAA